MIRLGILGFGFMGHVHFNNFKSIDGVENVAICDVDKERLASTAEVGGNFGDGDKGIDLSGIALYENAIEMFNDAKLDAVSITLPTYLHKEYTLKAFDAGLNVLCEKPMALNSQECQEMIHAAKKADKHLQIGHCIRFWPQYAEVKRIVDSGKYGQVKAATFRRLSLTPTWAWDNWITNPTRSGGAILDLHIHDSDYVQYLLGMPKSVFSRSAISEAGACDHVVTQYVYDGKVVTAEGGWMMAESFGFEMSFEIVLEDATICFDCTKSPAFRICPKGSEQITPTLETKDGYMLEMEHFAATLMGKDMPQVITPEDSKKSVQLIEAEMQSVKATSIEVCS